jgi:DNA-binding CsgD family transcriptional regulator
MPWRRLTDRELTMWEMRAGGASLASIGELYGVTESRVSQILSRSRAKLLR